ncbi:MAG: GNAT family N-acetyltransferase [Candidatus Hermodarchaeota archaeon]
MSKKELKKASEVLANAFSKDPIFEEMQISKELIIRMYEMIIRVSLRYGNVYATSTKFEGVMSITSDKNSVIKLWYLIRSGAIFPALKLYNKFGKLMKESGKILDEDKKNLNIGPYIYLGVIGVSQESQGKGYGGKMLRALINEAEAEGKAIYLETETKENVNMYNRFGFEIIKKFSIPSLNLPIWEMVRKRNSII